MFKLKNVMNLIKKYENAKRVIIIVFDRLQLQNKLLSIKKNRTKKSKIKLNYIIQFVVIDKIFFVVSNTFALVLFKQKFVVMIFLRSMTFSLFIITFIAVIL